MVGGLLVSQVLTLYFTPVYYIYLDKLRFGRARRVSHPESACPSTEQQSKPSAAPNELLAPVAGARSAS